MEQNYIKVRPEIARTLGLDGIRTKFPDGNYKLYWPDLLPLSGGWGAYARTINAVGARVLTPEQVVAEQNGTAAPAALPTPTDPQYLPAPGNEDSEVPGPEKPEDPEPDPDPEDNDSAPDPDQPQ